jgi:Xaa-Pro aminopeptidase
LVSEEEKSLLKKFLPEIMVDGIDYSLITMREANFFKIYGSLRKEFSEKYPNPNPIDDDDTFIDSLAQKDPKADLFREALNRVANTLEKIDKLKLLASDYEIACARLYCKYVLNCMVEADNPKRQKEVKQFVDAFTEIDLYEIVESYFKVMRKYGLPIHEEPYYFISPKRRREIIHTGEMLKRSTNFDDNEIRISLLEELL